MVIELSVLMCNKLNKIVKPIMYVGKIRYIYYVYMPWSTIGIKYGI